MVAKQIHPHLLILFFFFFYLLCNRLNRRELGNYEQRQILVSKPFSFQLDMFSQILGMVVDLHLVYLFQHMFGSIFLSLDWLVLFSDQDDTL